MTNYLWIVVILTIFLCIRKKRRTAAAHRAGNLLTGALLFFAPAPGRTEYHPCRAT